MANTLTWRDVTAPDLSTALRATQVTGNNLTQGFNTLGDALGNFNTYRQGQAANEVLNNAAGFSDPAKLRAAIADGSLFGGIDRSLVTPDTLKALNQQPGTLLNQGVTQEQLSHAQRMDPLLEQGQGLINTGQGELNRHNAAANPLLETGLGLDNQGKVISNDLNSQLTPLKVTSLADSNAASEAGTRSVNQTTDQNATTYGRGTAAYQADREAEPFINKLKTSINSPDDVQALLGSPEVKNLSPMAFRRVADFANGVSGSPTGVPSGPGRAGGAIASAAGGAPGTAAGNSADATYSFIPTTAPLSSQSVGKVLDFQKGDLASKTGGHTPVGTFQITADTLADYGPKVLGSNWKDHTFTPEVQDQIAHKLFDDRKNGDIRQTWPSLPDLGPNGYANKSWDEVKGLIAKGETKDDISGRNQELYDLKNDHSKYGAQVSTTTSRIDQALAQVNSNNIDSRYAATQTGPDSNLTPGELTARALGTSDKTGNNSSTSSYKSLSPAQYQGELKRVHDAVKGATWATAAAILEAHPEGADFIHQHIRPWLGGFDVKPETSAVDAEIENLNTGRTQVGSESTNAGKAISASIAAAGSSYEDASKALAGALRNRSLSSDQIDGYRQKVAQTRAILESKLNADSTKALVPKVNNPSKGEAKDAANTDQANSVALTDTPANAPAPASPSNPASAALAQAADPVPAAPTQEQIQAQTQAAADKLQSAQVANTQAKARLATAKSKGEEDISSYLSDIRQTERDLQTARLEHLLQGYGVTVPPDVPQPTVRGKRAAPKFDASALIGAAARD